MPILRRPQETTPDEKESREERELSLLKVTPSYAPLNLFSRLSKATLREFYRSVREAERAVEVAKRKERYALFSDAETGRRFERMLDIAQRG